SRWRLAGSGGPPGARGPAGAVAAVSGRMTWGSGRAGSSSPRLRGGRRDVRAQGLGRVVLPLPEEHRAGRAGPPTRPDAGGGFGDLGRLGGRVPGLGGQWAG